MLFPVVEGGTDSPSGSPIRDARKADSDPIEIEDTPASRRHRILELLGDGGKLRSTCIATHLGCSLKTESSSSVPTKQGLNSWWQGEWDLRSATIQ